MLVMVLVPCKQLCGDTHLTPSPSLCVWQVSRLNLSVDILVNAAGVGRLGRLDHSTSQDVEGQINLNVLGTTLLTRLFAQGE